MKKDSIKRLVALLLCLSLAVGSVTYRPQKANAVALTSTAAVVAIVASVMTACGVTYWAATQEDAVTYLSGKIDSYLNTLTDTYSSLFDWLGISSLSDAFNILNGGTLSVPSTVANKILGFVNWFNTTEGIVSNGSAILNTSITDAENNYFRGSVTYAYNSQGMRINYNIYSSVSGRKGQYTLYVPISGLVNGADYFATRSVVDSSLTFSYSLRGSSTSSKKTIVYDTDQSIGTLSFIDSVDTCILYLESSSLEENPSIGYVTINFTPGTFSGDMTRVIPSDNVAIPETLTEGQTLDILTTAVISENDTQEQACEAVLTEIVSTDGLTSTSSTETPAPNLWGWLEDMLDDLTGIVSDIYTELVTLPAT